MLSIGSYFDEWAGRGDTPDVRDKITDSDLVAVSMFSITFPAKAAVGLRKPDVVLNTPHGQAARAFRRPRRDAALTHPKQRGPATDQRKPAGGPGSRDMAVPARS
ncbi:DUF6308 family protein [Arthrobacter sp. ISL-69]|uniref:DUF6308 family protein n=1 Tax=Arthrobacter sp. ISL-69 TaxID=2819113 RepID=UPI0037C04BB9